MTPLTDRLGHTFGDPALLERALTHRSWCAEHPGHLSNERLEFLGDAVLGLIVADYAFRTYPDHGEGWLSRARASVVRATALAEMATDLHLGDHLRLGKGEAASGGREKPSILADSLEAVIGAVYLDGGWNEARRFVLDLLRDRLEQLADGDADQDHKSRLQELCARLFDHGPDYQLSEKGPEHDKEFRAEVWVDGGVWGTGTGRTKKQAEQDAAEQAVQRLSEVHAQHLPPDVVNGTLAPDHEPTPRRDETTDA
ncbi:MAG TPA: ribonuclease III [Acidimicrobiales bacterium]|nr:ribonuclease III [Acidimicrobiales bacterium]